MVGAAAIALLVVTCVAAGGEGQGDATHTNRLIHETSPYLLQHAHNPVDWYAWGPEAFEAARSQNKPIFLSVGYSTCYWCHVMERESFENEGVAEVMNAHFVSIKLDREERPDVDDIYMAAVQAQRGRGGWPMSVFLEPHSLKPFEGGTYYPREAFVRLLNRVNNEWRSDRGTVTARADELAARVRQRLTASYQPQPVGRRDVEQSLTRLLAGYDPANGGFQRSQRKFPLPARLELLVAAGWTDEPVRDALLHTLDRMAMGGIYDQVGGGFHRYSTDTRWLVPHFEKMLYDNAQLASVYAKVFELTGDEYYGEIVEETLDYVLREMTSPQGGFYSAQDAEVNAREGASYVWTADEVRRALADAGLAEHAQFAVSIYGLGRGNFRDPHHRSEGLKNVLYFAQRPEPMAGSFGLDLAEFSERLGLVNAALLAARNDRDQPGTDDKVLTEWNGLMIRGMIDGARALGEPRYVEAAERAARFILATMQTPEGGLLRTYRDGRAKINAFSGDYAHLIRGLLALHEATRDESWLEHAARLAGAARDRFWDESGGGYYDTIADQSDVFVRNKSMRDGVIPCASSVMVVNLLDLHEATGEASYLDDAAATLASVSARVRSGGQMFWATIGLDRMAAKYPDRLPGGGAVTAAPPGEPAIAPRTARRPTLPKTDDNPVTVEVSAEALEISPEGSADLEVTLHIKEGYHVNAHDPGLEGLVGLEVRLVGRAAKLDVEYPQGEPFRTEAFPQEIRVHTGSVTVPLSISRTGEWRGRPRLVLTYQVCDDKACFMPARTILPVRITQRP